MTDPLKHLVLIVMFAGGFHTGWWLMDKFINYVVEKQQAERQRRELGMKNITPRKEK